MIILIGLHQVSNTWGHRYMGTRTLYLWRTHINMLRDSSVRSVLKTDQTRTETDQFWLIHPLGIINQVVNWFNCFNLFDRFNEFNQLKPLIFFIFLIKILIFYVCFSESIHKPSCQWIPIQLWSDPQLISSSILTFITLSVCQE